MFLKNKVVSINNVKNSKPASNLDNEPIFSDISDQIFDKKIDKDLRQNNNYQMIFHQRTVLDGGGV